MEWEINIPIYELSRYLKITPRNSSTALNHLILACHYLTILNCQFLLYYRLKPNDMALPNRFLHVADFLKTSDIFYTIAIGMDSIYSYVSDSYDDNFSFGKGSLKGQHFSVTLHPDDISICELSGAKCFQDSSRLVSVTLRKHDGNGGFVITNWDMQAMLNTKNEPLGIFCVGYNITEFVETKSSLEIAKMRLDEIHLIQSHELRKPLANIIGLTDMLIDDHGETAIMELLPKLADASKELDSIVRKLSD